MSMSIFYPKILFNCCCKIIDIQGDAKPHFSIRACTKYLLASEISCTNFFTSQYFCVKISRMPSKQSCLIINIKGNSINSVLIVKLLFPLHWHNTQVLMTFKTMFYRYRIINVLPKIETHVYHG